MIRFTWRISLITARNRIKNPVIELSPREKKQVSLIDTKKLAKAVVDKVKDIPGGDLMILQWAIEDIDRGQPPGQEVKGIDPKPLG